MSRGLSWRVAAVGAAVVAVVAAGGAVAATQILSPKEQSEAVVDDAARQLGIEPSQLDAALKKALENRVDAAVAAGRLTKEQGEAIKARIASGEVPLFGFGRHHGRFGHRGPFGAKLDAAASYLGVSEDALRSELRDGKSLAQVARDHGKSVDGLVEALVDRADKKLDAAVAAGRLTKAEKQEMLEGLRARITDLVNGRFPPPFERFGRHFGLRHWADTSLLGTS
jgi:hypothetical protein